MPMDEAVVSKLVTYVDDVHFVNWRRKVRWLKTDVLLPPPIIIFFENNTPQLVVRHFFPLPERFTAQ